MQTSLKLTFHPIIVAPGTFRVSLCLSKLGDRAWGVLSLSQTLGFDLPEFASYDGEAWAIVLMQQHAFEAASETILESWDDKLRQLWEAAEGHIMISTNFQDCLTAV